MSDKKRSWFPTRRFGWGWGLPTAWQGWAVLAGFALLVLATAVILPPFSKPAAFAAAIAILAALALVICWIKGEPPRWRWGGD
jgi:hypothetical protein